MIRAVVSWLVQHQPRIFYQFAPLGDFSCHVRGEFSGAGANCGRAVGAETLQNVGGLQCFDNARVQFLDDYGWRFGVGGHAVPRIQFVAGHTGFRMVGISGTVAKRFFAVIASVRRRPVCICGLTLNNVAKPN